MDTVKTTTTHSTERAMARTHMVFGALLLVSAIAFWKTLWALLMYSLHDESCSHIMIIPLVSAYLLFTERERIFSVVRPAIAGGVGVILVGAALWIAAGSAFSWQGNESLSITTLALVLIWTGGFLCCYGLVPARAAAFPLLFLLLMVPLPDKALAWTIHALQEGSTDVSYFLFNAVGVPVLRKGFVLALPSVTIEVATECSGIRSSIALFITCLLAAHFYLRTWWKILLFVLLVFPLVVIKNGIRIATLTLLSIYVDPSFLHGRLHHEGGFVFFILALLLLLPVFLLLEKSERHSAVLKAPQTDRGAAGTLGPEAMHQ